MNLETLALVSLVLAAIPCGLFVMNLWLYRPLPRSRRREEGNTKVEKIEPPHIGGYGVSVLIPARNEEHNIRATLESVLTNGGVEFEIVVLDDHSTDRTAEIVRALSAKNPRLRLESAPSLPAGWCGKQHACHVLGQHAKHPLLVFMDADVRLAPDALARMATFMDRNIALASGVPRQELGTFSERLLIPLIHFILLGYLPMFLMRRTTRPAFSAGCGQLFIARAAAYHKVGGHAPIRATLHDGVMLPRLFRRAGFNTDLFDATDIATCRMYRTNAETWRGLGKNATEGLAALGTILPMTILLLGGQVLPFALMLCAPWMSGRGIAVMVEAAGLAYLPRLLAVGKFRQPVGAALLHPLGVAALLLIQWHALGRKLTGKPAEWKGRSYDASTTAQPARAI